MHYVAVATYTEGGEKGNSFPTEEHCHCISTNEIRPVINDMNVYLALCTMLWQ